MATLDRRRFLNGSAQAMGAAFLSSLPAGAWSPSGGTTAFAEIQGSERARHLLEDAFSIYSGRPDGNTFSRIIVPDKSGRKFFVNDNVWWKYTDTQCNFHGTYGWRPFFDSAYRQVDRNTWQEPFKYPVTRELQDYFRKEQGAPKAPPLGWLPYSYDPIGTAPFATGPNPFSITWYYSNSFLDTKTGKIRGEMDLSENTDYPLMNFISATDFILWERDTASAEQYVPKMDRFVDVLLESKQDTSGLLWVNRQGSQIEFAHGSWRYPGHTHVYLWKVFRQIQEVAKFVGRHDLVDKYAEREEKLSDKMPLFMEQGKWFVGGLKDSAGHERLGTGRLDGSPSSYFEEWHNGNAVMLNLVDKQMTSAIVAKIASIPALTANHLTLVNYPARPQEELDPAFKMATGKRFPPPGGHMNAGWFWMCAAGALYGYTKTRHRDLLDRLAEMLSDHHQHLSIDCYYDYGANKMSQFPERGHNSYSVTCGGSFGMLFRGLFDLRVNATSLDVSPNLPQECERLKTKAPVHYAGKQVYFDVRNGPGSIRRVSLNGKPYDQHTAENITLPYSALEAVNLLEIEVSKT